LVYHFLCAWRYAFIFNNLRNLSVIFNLQARHDSLNLPNLEHSRDLHTIISSSAPSTTIPVTVKPSAGSIGEKVADSMRPSSSHGAEKGESPRHVRPSGEASSSHPERDSEICSESSLHQSKLDAESLAASKSLPVATNQSAVSAVISSEGPVVDNVVIGRLDNHDKDEEVVTAKKYSRDFLLKFTEQYLVLPKGFEITSETDRALMSVYINISHQVLLCCV
jgi:translation initiation factor 4G